VQTDGTLARVETTDPAFGGNDRITGGNGSHVAFGGIGDDLITLGIGDHIVLGDLGFAAFSLTGQPIEVATTNPSLGGDDDVTLGNGRDIVLGGAGSDRISIGGGGGALLGDNGQVLTNGAGLFVRIQTRDSMHGGDDTLTAGVGASFVFGGTGSDDIRTDASDDVIAGDMASLTFLDGVRSVFLGTIEDPAYGGDDTVASGAGDDWVILGDGNDRYEGTSGLNIVIGDAGRIEGQGTTGIFLRVESIQPGTGGNDTIIGGENRDVQIGGAGEDYLDGRGGNDLMTGDNGLLTRVGDYATGERRFESSFIREGGDDTLIGGEGRDIMIGGIGNDRFSLFIGDDAVAGEFLRVRFVPVSGDVELITSFLTPALRDLDILVQITMGVNDRWGRSEITGLRDGVPEVAGDAFGGLGNLDFGKLLGERFDLLFLKDDLYGAALIEGMFALADLPELRGFRIPSEAMLILDAAPAATPGDGSSAPQPEQGSGDGAEPGDGAALQDALLQMLASADGAQGGWQLNGWRLRSH